MAIGARSRGGGGGGGGFRTSSSSGAGAGRNRGGTRHSEADTSVATPVHVSRFGWRRLWYGPSGVADTEEADTGDATPFQHPLWNGPSGVADTEEVSACKWRVYTFEKCGIINRKKGGKDALGCKLFRQNVDNNCTKYKAFWGIWWETEMKHKFCEDRLSTYERCLMPKKPEGWDSWCHEVKANFREVLEEFCGKKFD